MQGMQKKQVVWLLVRLLGVFSLYNSLRLVLIVFENLMMLSKASQGETLLSEGSGLITGWVIEAIIYFSLGLYLVIDGGFLFRMLNRESTENETELDLSANSIRIEES